MRGWSWFHWGRWRGVQGWSGFHVLVACACIGLTAPCQAMRYVTLLKRQASHWVRKPGATVPPHREFRPLDFGVNRSLLLGWYLRAKQGYTDAQPKRAGCPSGAGTRISWWASQPRSIRLGRQGLRICPRGALKRGRAVIALAAPEGTTRAVCWSVVGPSL